MRDKFSIDKSSSAIQDLYDENRRLKTENSSLRSSNRLLHDVNEQLRRENSRLTNTLPSKVALPSEQPPARSTTRKGRYQKQPIYWHPRLITAAYWVQFLAGGGGILLFALDFPFVLRICAALCFFSNWLGWARGSQNYFGGYITSSLGIALFCDVVSIAYLDMAALIYCGLVAIDSLWRGIQFFRYFIAPKISSDAIGCLVWFIIIAPGVMGAFFDGKSPSRSSVSTSPPRIQQFVWNKYSRSGNSPNGSSRFLIFPFFIFPFTNAYNY